jgi:hypothetical protein
VDSYSLTQYALQYRVRYKEGILLFWDIVQCIMVIPCQCFRTAYWFYLQMSRNPTFLTIEDGTNRLS